MKKIAIFIPCYNVARRIRRFLLSFDEETLNKVHCIICVNNLSTDSTFKILKDVKKNSNLLKEKLFIFNNKKNYGLGGSHKIVFSYLLDNDFSHCLIVPSSYRGSPNEITKLFLDKLSFEPDVDVFFGKRIINTNLDLNTKIVQKMSQNIAEPLKMLLADYKLSDIGSRFVLLRCEILKAIAFKSLSDSYEFNLQFNVLLSEMPNIKISEVDLKHWNFSDTNPRKVLRYSTKLIKTMSRFGINKYVFKRNGWRLFGDFPDNLEREYDIL